MRRYYVNVPRLSVYNSDRRFVIALEDGEQIAGVHRGHQPLVVIAPRGSYHHTCGDMPRHLPDGRLLSVFKWERTGVCQYAEGEAPGETGVLWAQDCRANDVRICRTKRQLTLRDTDTQPFDSAWEWSFAPLEDMDPELTASEDALAALYPQFRD